MKIELLCYDISYIDSSNLKVIVNKMAKKSDEKITLKKLENRNTCAACMGTGVSYWSDDVYGPCIECDEGDKQMTEKINKQKTDSMIDETIQYVYLLQTRESRRLKEDIYKIGRTKQVNEKRFMSYPKGSVLYLQISCKDCSKCERKIKTVFNKLFKLRKDMGCEYFEGNRNEMIKLICEIVQEDFTEKGDSNEDSDDKIHVAPFIYSSSSSSKIYYQELDDHKLLESFIKEDCQKLFDIMFHTGRMIITLNDNFDYEVEIGYYNDVYYLYKSGEVIPYTCAKFDTLKNELLKFLKDNDNAMFDLSVSCDSKEFKPFEYIQTYKYNESDPIEKQINGFLTDLKNLNATKY